MRNAKSFALVALLLLCCSPSLFSQAPAPLHVTVPSGQAAKFRLQPQDDNGTAEAVTNGTLALDDTTYGYVAQDNIGQIVFVARSTPLPPAGTTKTVTLTVNATNAQGQPLTPYVILFDIPGPPLPPPATHFFLSSAPYVNDNGKPNDPGSATAPVVF
jgi:hypothetical protein